MNVFILLLLMISIGALIGGLTNSLAIKMLFRPYRALYIGRFRLPFTPGLIPKRQNELAKQLGRMVVNHLLTPEGLRRKLERPQFHTQMTAWAQKEIEEWLDHPKTIESLLSTMNPKLSSEQIEKYVSEWVEKRFHSMLSEHRHSTLESLLSEEWRDKVEEGSDRLADYIHDSVMRYFQSAEGKRKVTALIENYLDNQGFLGNMISSFLGPDGLTERIYPAMIRYISDDEMKYWLRGMLKSELEQLLKQPVGFYEEKLKSITVGEALGRTVAKSLPIEAWLSKSVKDWTGPYRNHIIQQWVPRLVNESIVLLSSKIESMMDSMHLAEIVQEEVEAFHVGRVEEMVLGISRREFKMITYLGALLGGIIGLLQGIIVLFFG
ncbi:DUF445 family protein [Halobacillus yeomjeoni]|uniref:DUF445 domain-containing protein n=1 Tax=Halobacillus yeomjeoni TaxID=311194 RepID=UPI001CD574DC|nr:DUF445 family protein [Halobacillus yeomjeoni]MCA0983904.1 DUF445 family protein [Halobacillus yeomjeoni]